MNDANLNYEQKFFIEHYALSGVVSIDGGYEINEEPLNILGHGYFDSLVNAPLQGNFNITRSLITRDPLLNYTGECGFNGGIYYNGTSFDFVSGYLDQYSVNCSIGSIPEVNSSISVYGNIGGKSRTLEKSEYQPYESNFATHETGEFSISSTGLMTGVLTTGITTDPDVTKLNAKEGEDYKWIALTGDHPVPATPVLLPEEEGEIIQIPDQGSIIISGFGTESNRVQSFTYDLTIPREPIYAVGKDRPVQVSTIPPYEITANILIHIDDYEAKNVFDYLIQPPQPHENDLSILVQNSDKTSTIGRYNIPNARLVAENITAAADSQLEISLTYRGYFNALDETLISGALSGNYDIPIDYWEEECREPTIPTYTPTALPATAHTQNCFTANWRGHVMDHDYYLDVSKEDPFFNNENKIINKLFIPNNGNPGVIYSKEICGLDPGTVYYYRVKSTNEKDEESNWSNVVSTITIPTETVITGISDCQDSPNFGYRINWNSVKGAAEYLIDVADNVNFENPIYNGRPVSTSSFLADNLSAGKVYYSRVISKNISGESGYSNIINHISRAPKPNNPRVIDSGRDYMQITWDSVPSADIYKVSIFIDGAPSPIDGYNRKETNDTSLTVKDLIAGTKYYFEVYVENDCGETSPTSPVTHTLPPGKVSNIIADACTLYGFRMSWDNLFGVSSYEVDVTKSLKSNGAPDFSKSLQNYNPASTTQNSLIVSQLEAGTQYYFRVIGKNEGGKGVFSEIGSKTTIPPTPLLNPVTEKNQDSFRINWTDSKGAESYEVDVSIKSNNFNPNLELYDSRQTEDLFIDVTGLSAGEEYKFRVRAINDCGISASSDENEDCAKPDTPTNLSTSNVTTNSLTLSWGAVTEADHYLINVSETEGMSPTLPAYSDKIHTSNSIDVVGLKQDTQYYFTVKSVKTDCGTSPPSNAHTEITAKKTKFKVALPATDCTLYGFTANWETDPDTESYELNLSTSPSFSSFVSPYNTNFRTTSNKEVIPNLSAGTRYYYRLRGHNQHGHSDYSSTITVLTLPTEPQVSISEETASSFKASWPSIQSATAYEVDLSKNQDFSTFIEPYEDFEILTNEIVFLNLEKEAQYYVRVRAKNEGCGTGNNSAAKSGTTKGVPNPPSGLAKSACTLDGFTVSWSADPLADSYNLVVSEDEFFNDFINPYDLGYRTTNLSKVITGLDSGTKYYYKVRSISQYGNSPFSSTSSTTTPPPAPTVSIISKTATSITVSWNATKSATKYEIDYSDDNGTSYTTIENITSTQHTITGLDENKDYKILVRAGNEDCGFGQNSSSKDGSTGDIPNVPGGVSTSNCTQGGFQANWQSQSNATSYQIILYKDGAQITSVTVPASANSHNFSNLEDGTQYTYKVKSINEFGSSPLSSAVSVTTKPPAPKNISVSNLSSNAFDLSWDTALSSTEYDIDIATDLNFNNIVQSLSSTTNSKSIDSLTPNTAFYIRIRGSNASCGDGEYSTAKLVQTPNTTPSKITLSSASDCTYSQSLGYGFSVNWQAESSSDKYTVDISESNDFTPLVSTLNTNLTTQPFVGLKAGTQYFFRVKGVNDSASGEYSDTGSKTTIPPAVENLSFSNITCGGCVDISFDAALGALSYDLYIATDSAFSTLFSNYDPKNLATTSIQVCGLSKGVEYFVKIIAKNDCGDSSGNSSSFLTPPSPTVARPATSATSTQFVANWDQASLATHYFIDVATDSAFSNILTAYNKLRVSTTSKQIEGLTEPSYYYRIYAANESGYCDPSNSQTVQMVLGAPSTAAPSGLTKDCSISGGTSSLVGAGFTASWNQDTASDGYYLDVSNSSSFITFIDGFDGKKIEGASTTSAVVDGIPTGRIFYYRVRSYNSSGESANSDIRQALTLPFRPLLTAQTEVQSQSVRTNWVPVFSENLTSSSQQASSYKVTYSTNANMSNPIKQDQVTTSASYVIEPLLAGQTYYYQVVATNESGDSCESEIDSFITAKALLKQTEELILKQDGSAILLELSN